MLCHKHSVARRIIRLFQGFFVALFRGTGYYWHYASVGLWDFEISPISLGTQFVLSKVRYTKATNKNISRSFVCGFLERLRFWPCTVHARKQI